jgi:hypothetical protein
MGLFGKKTTQSSGRARASIIKADPNYPDKWDRCKIGEAEYLVHFLDPLLAVCYEHQGLSACLGYTITAATFNVSFSDECPLCRKDDKPQFYSVYNVVVLAQSQGPKFSRWDIQMRGIPPYRRPTLKLLFAPLGFNKEDGGDYHWVNERGAYRMTGDHLVGEYHVQPLTSGEMDKFSLVKWTNEQVMTTPDVLPRMSLRRPDRRGSSS